MYGCMYACQTACLDVYMCVGWSVGMCVYMCVYDVRSLWMQSDLYVGVGDIPFRKRPTEINLFCLRHTISQVCIGGVALLTQGKVEWLIFVGLKIS